MIALMMVMMMDVLMRIAVVVVFVAKCPGPTLEVIVRMHFGMFTGYFSVVFDVAQFTQAGACWRQADSGIVVRTVRTDGTVALTDPFDQSDTGFF